MNYTSTYYQYHRNPPKHKNPRQPLRILRMIGPDPAREAIVQSCIFCHQSFTAGERWLKIGFRWVGYIGAHITCSERKDAELRSARLKA